MHADLESIVCKFGGDPAICLVEEAICAKSLQTDRWTDGRTDDGCHAIALARWNELKMVQLNNNECFLCNTNNYFTA